MLLIPWLVIIILYSISSLLYLIYSTNKTFQQILQLMTNGISHWYIDTKVRIKNFYSILCGSIIILIMIITLSYLLSNSGFAAQITITTTLTQDHFTNFPNGSRYAIWNEQIDLISPTIINHNSTKIYVTWLPNSTNDYTYLTVNETGQKIVKMNNDPNSINYDQIENYNYTLKISSNNYQVLEVSGQLNPSRNLLGHFLPWLVAFTKNGPNSIYGLRIRDIYRAAYAGLDNNMKVWTTNLTFSGIEQLITFNVYEQANVEQNSGLLVDYHFIQTESIIVSQIIIQYPMI